MTKVAVQCLCLASGLLIWAAAGRAAVPVADFLFGACAGLGFAGLFERGGGGMKPSARLRKALELFGPNGEHWAQGYYGYKADGTEALEPREAICFCATGAISAADERSMSSWMAYLDTGYDVYLKRVLSTTNIPAWNDDTCRTFSEVKAAFEAAIALAESEGQ